jgi:uncharacterized protein YxeA
MKKFMKFLLAVVAIGGVIAGAIYFLKNVVMKDYLDDYDDDDFDNDLYDEDEDDREYVTINPTDGSDEEKDADEEADDAEETSTTDSSDMEFEN